MLAEGASFVLGATTIQPLCLAERYVYAFLLEGEGKRVFLAPDETFQWEPPQDLGPLDLALLPMGIVELDPFTRERRIPRAHPILQSEATFEQTLELVRRLNARQTVLSHIEEMDGLTIEVRRTLEERLRRDGLSIRFAFDTMVLEP
ncbi:MAG: MBL fold metallo-hydrolase [Chloroflexi bacterium]|nr:MBL fold metallo-hydrolase [Chloroflexota bacterium]